MQALVVRPGEAHTTRVADVPQPPVREGEVAVRTLEVGVCGTDREISEGHFGVPPEGEDVLVLGHEFLGRVERDGDGFTRATSSPRSCGARAPSASPATRAPPTPA